ncbi:MAG: hypothetical protein SGI86_02570, partial [Deltaproteobacteria bacterium]|nr:hypothetical protein [Deltaproteobacteria bacterium]
MRFQWPTFSVRVPIHGLVVLGLALWFAACGFEPENRCSPDQIFNDEINVCVCPPGTMTVDRACISCPSNEKVVGGQCVCADGLQRGPNGVCAQGIPGLAESCVPGGSATCSNPVYPSCNPSSAGGGYCTSSGCSNDANCPAGFTCATWASPSYCMRPPTGVGKACASPGDCAG